MRPFISFATLGLAALCAATTALAGEVYKWTDDAGVVQYTDYVPEGRAFEKLKTTGSKAPAPVAPVPVEESAEAATVAAPAAGTPEANCAAARQNVDNISRFADVTMDRDGDGTPEKLTPEQRITELERNESLVSLYCPQETVADGQ